MTQTNRKGLLKIYIGGQQSPICLYMPKVKNLEAYAQRRIKTYFEKKYADIRAVYLSVRVEGQEVENKRLK